MIRYITEKKNTINDIVDFITKLGFKIKNYDNEIIYLTDKWSLKQINELKEKIKNQFGTTKFKLFNGDY